MLPGVDANLGLRSVPAGGDFFARTALSRKAKSTELNDSIKHFQSVFRKASDCVVLTMQAAQDYASVKAHLEEKVASLRRERESVLREVDSLGLKVAIKELEKQARSLEVELDGLKGKRSVLEQKLASLDAPAAQSSPPQQRPPIRQVGQ